jgi:hypothetical protein
MIVTLEQFAVKKGFNKDHFNNSQYKELIIEFAKFYSEAEKIRAQIEIIDKVLDDIYFTASCTDGLEEYSNAYYELLSIRDRKTILEQELEELENEKR